MWLILLLHQGDGLYSWSKREIKILLNEHLRRFKTELTSYRLLKWFQTDMNNWIRAKGFDFHDFPQRKRTIKCILCAIFLKSIPKQLTGVEVVFPSRFVFVSLFFVNHDSKLAHLLYSIRGMWD